MNSRKFNTNPQELLEEGKKIMTASDESKFYFRVFAVNMVLSGFTAGSIGNMAGVTRQAVSGWVKTVDEQGFEALRPQKHTGRPSKLLPEQLTAIDTVLQSDPSKYGFKVWDGPSLSAYIKTSSGIEVGVRQCQRLLHKLGFSRNCPLAE